MKAKRKLANLGQFRKSILFTVEDAKGAGVSSGLLAYYVRKGNLRRLSRGIYRDAKAECKLDLRWEDLVVAALSIPDGAICLVSALAIYNLTEEIPREHWIAIPHRLRAPHRNGIRGVRMRNMSLGKTEMTLGGGRISIFDRERTLVDSFRYLGRETAIKALKMYFSESGRYKPDIQKLRAYARKLRVPIEPYLITVTV